jgi:hypothetical protein
MAFINSGWAVLTCANPVHLRLKAGPLVELGHTVL